MRKVQESYHRLATKNDTEGYCPVGKKNSVYDPITAEFIMKELLKVGQCIEEYTGRCEKLCEKALEDIERCKFP
jgi:hypothetical protein